MKSSIKGTGGAIITLLMAASIILAAGFTAPTRGQDAGVYRGRQGRRVGGATLPTPPFNPNAGILGSRGVNHRRSTGRGVGAANRNPAPGTTRRRAVRRGRNIRHRTPRKSVVNQS